MKNCLIIDTETNGDKNDPICIEIGWVLYSIEHQTMLNCGSFLCNQGTENKAQLINRIPSPVPEDYYYSAIVCDDLEDILDFDKFGDYLNFIVAHNKEYDKKIIENYYGLRNFCGGYFEKTWLCTYEDFKLFPSEYQGKRDLISLAQFYGVGISSTHRAIYDCLLIAEVFNRVSDLKSHFDLAVKRLEKVTLVAQVTFDDKDLAKEKGFKWFPDLKQWQITIPKIEKDDFVKSLNFKTVEVSNDE